MKLREWLLSPWLTVRLQIALGVIFVVAALPKIYDPPSFAQMIYNYRLTPGFAINFIALVMPWTELLVGVALILGLWRRPAVFLIGVMLVIFIVAIGINLVRDNAVDCGCFEVNPVEKTHDQLVTDMWIVLLRDVGMLFMVAQIWIAAGGVQSSKFEVQRDAPAAPA